MKRLHMFFPENDLALARDLSQYTPPPAAARLRHAGECLPLWYGEPGDTFVSSGINGAWLDNMLHNFGMDIDTFDYRPNDYMPMPWGWSKAARKALADLGFKAEQLPDDSALSRMRELSHRRTSLALRKRIGELYADAPLSVSGVECRTTEEVEAYLDSVPEVIVKLPWSSSGRGLVPIDPNIRQRKISEIGGMINRQGSVICEPRVRIRSNFALLYLMTDCHAEPAGISLFTTDPNGAYSGNILKPQSEIFAQLDSEAPGLEALIAATGHALEDIIGKDYSGPLGVDMATIDGASTIALFELNLRMTMGHLCVRLYDRFIRPGAKGIFTVNPAGNDSGTTEAPVIANKRLQSGRLILNPPGSDFIFAATVQ